MALHALRSDGRFDSPGNQTGTLTRLTFVIRLVLAGRIQEKIRSTGARSTEVMNQAWEEVEHSCTVGHESTFNTIRFLQHFFSSISYLTMGLPRIWWKDSEGYTEMLYRGETLKLDQLRTIVANAEEELVRIWREDVIMGLNLYVNWKGVKDDMTNMDTGHSFLTDPRNKKHFDGISLVQAIQSTPHLQAKFCTGFNRHQRQWLWNGKALENWLLKAVRPLHHLLAVLLDLSSGAPIRITELGALLALNTTGRSRNLMIVHEYVVLIRNYTKTSTLRGYNQTIPHALSAVVSDILIQYLAIAREFAIFAAIKVWGPESEQVRLYHSRLLVDFNKSLEAEVITKRLNDLAFPVLQWKFGVSDARHALIAFSRHHCRSMSEFFEVDEYEDIRDKQAGHSTGTARAVYGVSDQIWRTPIAEEVMKKFLDFSTDWQKVLRIMPGKYYAQVTCFYQDSLSFSKVENMSPLKLL